MKKPRRRARKPLKRPSKNLTRVLFALYLLLLTWVVLFQREVDLGRLAEMDSRSLNLIPFGASTIGDGTAGLWGIAWNVAAFVPFGVYITMLHKSWSFPKKLLPIFCVSLAFEVLQYIFAIGGSDITDLLGGTLGGLFGIGLFLLLWAVLGVRALRLVNVAASIGTAAAALILGVLTAFKL